MKRAFTFFRSKFVIGFVMGAVLFYAVGLVQSQHLIVLKGKNLDLRNAEMKLSSDFNMQVDFARFVEVLSLIHDRYYLPSGEKFDMNALMDEAVVGLVNGLGDRHSVYMLPDETKAFRDNLNGELQGIGAELRKKGDDAVEVVNVLKGTPAAGVGLLPNDLIVSVDDKNISDMSFFDVIMNIRGKKGTTVNLDVLRKGNRLAFEIVRDRIKVESVEYTMHDDVAVVEVNNFGTKTALDFDRILREVKEKNPTGIVIDLRYNPGGILSIAVDMIGKFLPSSELVTFRRSNDMNEEYRSKGEAIFPEIPVVVLVNKASASASEIFAGAFQDHMRGKIIGDVTFGKGSVQEPFEYRDHKLLKLTTSRWYTPLGRTIDHVGIVPDIEVERTQEDVDAGLDPQLDKALEVVMSDLWRQESQPLLGSGAVVVGGVFSEELSQ